jgi:hypothetical protein
MKGLELSEGFPKEGFELIDYFLASSSFAF